MLKILGLSLSVLFSFQAFGLSEANLETEYDSKIVPFYNSMVKKTMLNGQGMKLSYRYKISSVATKTVVILTGRAESSRYYSEFMHDLSASNVNIFILNHQGQGESDRHMKNTQKGHVNHFSDYVNDVKLWVNTVVSPLSSGTEMVLIAHSMGGAISAHYLSSNTHPFKKVVLLAPMMEINTKPYSERVALTLTGTLANLGRGKDYQPGGKDYNHEKNVFETNDTTHSEVRFAIDRYNKETYPAEIISGPTVRWIQQSLKATMKIDKLAKKVTIPILMLQAGKDLIVKPGRQKKFCDKAPQCQLLVFPEAHHAFIQEKDEIRNPAFSAMKEFLKI